MSDRRITTRFIRKAVLASMLACAVSQPLVADDSVPSRDYPPTYSSNRAPWYDPFRIFTSAPKTTESKPTKKDRNPINPVFHAQPTWRQASQVNQAPTAPPRVPAAMPVPLPVAAPTPVAIPVAAHVHSNMPVPVHTPVSMPVPVQAPTGPRPSWQWYGYGAPAPTNMGAVIPGVMPIPKSETLPPPEDKPKPGLSNIVPPPSRHETASGILPPSEGPRLAGISPKPETTEVDWKSSANARLKLPTSGAIPATADAPQARLKAPVAIEEKATTPIEYATPLSRLSPPSTRSTEIPVVPAPGIVVPK